MHERATEVAVEVHSWPVIHSLEHLHTYRLYGDSEIPPILISIVVRTVLFFLLLLFGSAYLYWSLLNAQNL